ncbi:long-chain-fatty-acid--CoA ligase [Alicyclobacillus contaminans]|uniref:long-chain-fatty-acid--CoA ligase n=1 Tax=Alicyclobacillus contaminans TaxID=392016 RepID=UPI00041248A7|nr:long-chain-fatty-acid--CoA ligase [Alicyclobacillus contaminans]
MITPLTPLDFFRRALKYYPDKLAVVDGELRFTYQMFGQRVYRLANGLRQLGVGPGVKVAALMPNTHQMLECFQAIPLLGAVLVPLNIRLQAEELRYIIDHSDSEIVLFDAEWSPVMREVLPNLPKIRHVVQVEWPGFPSLDGVMQYESLLDSSSDSPVRAEVDENDPITINYTSGTTSRPKGVVLTHRNTFTNAADFLFHLRFSPEDVYLHTLPMFHVNGWGGVWAVSALGCTHVCLRKVNPVQVLQLFQDEGVTVACGAPTVLSMLLQAPNVNQVKLAQRPRIATAGSPPPAAVLERVHELLGMEVIHVYGLTEVSPFISYCEWRQEFNQLPASEQAALRACQGVEQLFNGETKVVREDGTEVAWDGKEIGEIVCRGNVVMKEYYKQPEETARAFAGGWFHTGDLAVVHANGYIEIVDRLKDVIISGGENVSSVEVEGVLYQHPAVADAGVVSRPDERWGEVPVAFVVVKPGHHVTQDELNAFCRDRLAHYKVPKDYVFVSELPRTATGKLQKFRLRERFWQGQEKRVQ